MSIIRIPFVVFALLSFLILLAPPVTLAQTANEYCIMVAPCNPIPGDEKEHPCSPIPICKPTPLDPEDCQSEASKLRQKYGELSKQAAGLDGQEYAAVEAQMAAIQEKLGLLAQACRGSVGGLTVPAKGCTDKASKLQQQYYAWAMQAANANGQEYVAIQAQMAAIRKQLKDLAEQCGDAGGSGSPQGSASPSRSGGGGQSESGGGGGSGGGGSRGGAGIAPPGPHPIGGDPVRTILLPVPPAGQGAVPKTPKGLPTMVIRDGIARQRLRESWQHLSNVQPRADIDTEAALPASAPALADASDIARPGLASVDQLEREAAALDAYTLSLARFLGAKQNGNQAAVSRQAGLMLRYIDMAIEAANLAARSRSIADRLILTELEKRQARAKQRAGGWNEELSRLGKLSASDLPTEVREELKSSGIQKEEPALERDLNALRPSEIDKGIADLRAHVDAEGANPAPPPDLPVLEDEQNRARALASSAGVRPPLESGGTKSASDSSSTAGIGSAAVPANSTGTAAFQGSLADPKESKSGAFYFRAWMLFAPAAVFALAAYGVVRRRSKLGAGSHTQQNGRS